MPRYLGLDSSTQSLSAMVIDTDFGEVVLDHTVNFGADLPEYNCPNGFLENTDPLVKHSDPLLWAAALDKLLAAANDQGFDWSSVNGVSGSGQQHGSVYLNKQFFDVVRGLDPDLDLAAQLKPCLSRSTAPIWMDSSTNAECREIAAAAGGDDKVVAISGSRAIERFTGPQIRKFHKDDREGYEATARIHLVSSFMASLLAGADVNIDYGDGAGMNLLDLAAGEWSQDLLDATAPNLRSKLPPPVPSSTSGGKVAPYFVKKYGFSPDCEVIAFSGDNPCSLVGMGAIAPGTAVVSLGTSDTFFAAMGDPVTDPNGYGHVFGNPAGGFMSLVCFKNGSLAREAVVDKIGDVDWDCFANLVLNQSEPGNNDNLMLPFFEPETTPLILDAEVKLYGHEDFCSWSPAAAMARAVLEGQALNMKLHSEWIGETPTAIRVTGGASRNPAILQVLADVFQAGIQRLRVSNSAALGAALRAANGVDGLPWDPLFDSFCDLVPGTVEPNPALATLYAKMEQVFAEKLRVAYGVQDSA